MLPVTDTVLTAFLENIENQLFSCIFTNANFNKFFGNVHTPVDHRKQHKSGSQAWCHTYDPSMSDAGIGGSGASGRPDLCSEARSQNKNEERIARRLQWGHLRHQGTGV